MKYNYRLAGLFAIFSFMGAWGFGRDWHVALGVGTVVGLCVLSLSVYIVNIESRS